DVESNQPVFGQDVEIKVAELRLGVVAVFAGERLGRHAEVRRREHPVRISEAVEEPEVFELAIRAVKAVPLRQLDTETSRTVWICAPACRRHQRGVKQAA